MSSLSQFSEVDEICTDFEHLSKSSLNGIGAADDETVVKFCSCVTVEELRSFLACEYEMMSYCWTCFCTDVRLLSMTYFCLKRFLLQYKYLRLHNHQLIDTFCIMHVMLLNPHRQCIYLLGFHIFTQIIRKISDIMCKCIYVVILCSIVAVSVFYLFSMINVHVIWCMLQCCI